MTKKKNSNILSEKTNNNIKINKEFDWNIPHTRHEIFHQIYKESEAERIKEEKELKTKKQKK
ncbi:MAG: hypothetical protein mread185_000355 [Mycoplasmataceae bacterium]|nr:MAG: hypothetical protein mread185_000355 [Mycoplasmataceae bacterium]